MCSKKLFKKYSKETTEEEILKNITHIFLNDKQIIQIESLKNCEKLKVLYLHDNHIKKIENLNGLINLTHLYLQWNKIEKIENINHLKNLQKLYLSGNRIKCLENIENLKNLEELYIGRQYLENGQEFLFDQSSLNAISKNLKILNITKLNLKNLDFLKNFHKLEILIASDNLFTNLDKIGLILNKLPCLKKVNFIGCPIQNNINYRNRIVAKAACNLQNLDGKLIQNIHRTFIKRFEQIKSQRKSKLQSNKHSKTKIINKSNDIMTSSSGIPLSITNNKEIFKLIGSKKITWNTELVK